MEALYMLTETHPSELSGDGSYFVRQRLDWTVFAGCLDYLELLC